MAGDSIKFNASLNTAAFESGAKNLQNLAASASAGITRHFGKIATAVVGIGAAFIGVRAAVQAFSSAIAMGGELDDLTKRTGLAAGEILLLQKAFELGGSSADAVGGTIDKLRRSIVQAGNESSAQAESFSALGLSVSELKNLTPTEQLEKVASAIMRVGNDSQRSAIAMDIFGKSGGELVPLFSNFAGELEKARGYLGSTPQIMTRVSETFADLGDNFAAIGEKGKEFMVGLLEKLAPGLADLTDRLANIDAAGFGAKLSEYAERTAAWISQTFKLGDALNNLEVAIKGITSGNFGDGLSLMFMTARDTALNAINNIVAAAGAALQTVGAAIGKLFDPSSTTMAFIEGSFQMLGAKIASGIFDAIATVLEKLPFMGAASAAVREAQKEAEQAIKDISNIMYYEADNLKSEWGGIMREMPKEFAASYKANMERPLFDMKDRAAETAEQMEKVAAATRAAAFDAEKFGQALRDAQVNKFAGESADSPFPANTRGGGASMPAEPAPTTPAPSSGSAARRGGGLSQTAPQTSLDRLRQSAQDDPRARAEMFRIQNEQSRTTDRAGTLREGGMFRSAADAEIRGERRAEQRAENFRAREIASERFGGRNMGEAFNNFRRMMSEQGVFGSSQQDFEKWAKEQAKSEKQREQEERGAGAGGKGDAATKPADPMAKVATDISAIRNILTQQDGIHDRLPIRVMAAA